MRKLTHKMTLAAALTATAALAAPAHAGNAEGKFQVKVMASALLPNGEMTELNGGNPGAIGTKADDSYVPTLAFEYFFSPNFSAETICCLAERDIVGTGAISGAHMIDDALILPATLTLKAHLDLGGVKPYVGAGPAYFFFIDEHAGIDSRQMFGATHARINDKFGAALQAGVDIPVNDKGLGITLDAKRYFMRTSAFWYDSDGNEVLRSRHKLDPWLLSAGVAYRF